MNPKYDSVHVELRREEIKKKLDGLESEIINGEVIVFAEDEAHTLWGDPIGHVWCRENERTEVPMQNAKERQTYYGVLNLYNHGKCSLTAGEAKFRMQQLGE